MTSMDVEPPRVVVTSVLRALRMLELFEPGRPEMSLAEFVRRSGYSKTTAYRLLITLEQAGWLERGLAGAFRLTIKPFQVGSILVDSLDLRREAAPIMARLAAETDETIYLVVPDGPRAVCLERIDSGQGVRLMDLHVGGSQPLNLGAAPRALLAFDEEHLLPGLLAEGLTGRTPHSLVDVATLRADLEETRRRGYSISDEDVTPGIGAIGAPVLAGDGRAIAGLSVGGLQSRVLPPRTEHVAALLTASRELSARLGHADAPPRGHAVPVSEPSTAG